MRALRLREIGSIDLLSVPAPQAADGEVVVQVSVAGICGTDRHLISGEYPAIPPVTLGHELEGIVTATGTGTTMAVGTRVAVDPNIACLNCRYCRMGLVAHCLNLHAIGVDRDGGLAEFVNAPQRQAYELPADLPAGFGALCEPLACCLHAMDHATVQPGDKVAVLGGGVIGQLCPAGPCRRRHGPRDDSRSGVPWLGRWAHSPPSTPLVATSVRPLPAYMASHLEA